MKLYILDKQGLPKLEPNIEKWAVWMEKADRTICFTIIGNVAISTVFLALDHSLGGMPLLYETMVFGGKLDEKCRRYHTRTKAELGHTEMVELVKAGEFA